jgi:hypothetical protein
VQGGEIDVLAGRVGRALVLVVRAFYLRSMRADVGWQRAVRPNAFARRCERRPFFNSGELSSHPACFGLVAFRSVAPALKHRRQQADGSPSHACRLRYRKRFSAKRTERYRGASNPASASSGIELAVTGSDRAAARISGGGKSYFGELHFSLGLMARMGARASSQPPAHQPTYRLRDFDRNLGRREQHRRVGEPAAGSGLQPWDKNFVAPISPG